MSLYRSELRKHWPILIVITVIAVTLRLHAWGGYIGLDDGEYAKFAYEMAQGQSTIEPYSGPAVFPLRVGIIAPASWAFNVIGFSEWSLVIYPLLMSMAGLFTTYLCASVCFTHRTALIASALYAIIPLDIDNATVLLPDLPAAVYASIGITTLVVMMRASISSRWALFVGGCAVGLAFGMSWLCKESVSYFVLTCAVFFAMAIKQSPERGVFLWGGVGVGSLLILIGEMAVYHSNTGDWLFRLHEIERNYRQWENAFFTEGSDFGWPKGTSRMFALFKRLFVTGPAFVFANSYFLFVPLFGLVGCLYAWYWRDRTFLLPGIWLMTLFLMFNFSTSSFSSYSPLPLFNRYFYPILFPSVILTAGLLGRLMFSDGSVQNNGLQRERVFWGGLLSVFLLFMGGMGVYWEDRVGQPWTAEVRAVSKMVQPSTTLYADVLTIRGLEFFQQYPRQTNWVDFESLKSPEVVCAGSLVLVNPRYIAWLNKNGGMWLSKRSGYKSHDFYERAPETWKRIYEHAGVVLYEAQQLDSGCKKNTTTTLMQVD
jgi:4-amino-4-deoxy-L-arabinose transferase-like glycosyltransferase